MKSTAVSSSDWSWLTRSRTSASTVASSPVVGSSRINNSGFLASAMAITTRCCMPPESWCGYRVSTLDGSAICTVTSASFARSRASLLGTPSTVNASATCVPTFSDGFNAEPGFWYTIETVRAW